MATIALNFKSNAKETNKDMKNLGQSIKNVGGVAFKAFGLVATAAAGAATAIAAVAVNSAQNRKELVNMARLAGLGAREFEKLTFATQQYDISAEQFSDISKDVTEKLGEFAAVGSGAFTGFMDVMGMSEGSARKLAKELGNMPAPEALLQLSLIHISEPTRPY